MRNGRKRRQKGSVKEKSAEREEKNSEQLDSGRRKRIQRISRNRNTMRENKIQSSKDEEKH